MITLSANGPGIGDAIFLTAVARQIKLFTRQQVTTVTAYPEILHRNPYVDVSLGGWKIAGFPQLHDQASIKEHNVSFMCQVLKLPPIPWENIRQYLHAAPFSKSYQYVTMQIRAGNWTRNKDWSDDKWEELAYRITEELDISVIQLGAEFKEPALSYAKEAIFGANLQHVASVIQGAKLHIGLVSGLMHMASGVGTKSVIVYGGRERPEITGYYDNINITNEDCELSPCWMIPDCPHKRFCMSNISVEQVFQGVKHALYS